jgi:hypothetical protein
MPFDGKNEIRFGYDPEAVEAFRQTACEAIVALDALAALFDGGRHWIRNKERDEKGRFCLRGGVHHIGTTEHPSSRIGYYLKAAIRELVGRSMTIPAFNDSAPDFGSIAYVICRARELAIADADGKPHDGTGNALVIAAVPSASGNGVNRARPVGTQPSRRLVRAFGFWFLNL